MSTRVLLVDVPAGLSLLRRIMSGYDLSEVKTLESAKEALGRSDIDLLVVGIHFDDSHSLDFIKAAREHKSHKETPIVVFRSFPSDLSQFLRGCIRDVSKHYNIFSYVETDQYTSNEAVRKAIEAALPSQKQCVSTSRPTKPKPGRILLAASSAVRPIIERMMPDHHELCHAKTLDEARLLLEHENFDGIVCTVLFDRGRIFDFLYMVRSHNKWKDIPCVCALCPGTVDAPMAIEPIESVCKSQGCRFVNCADYSHDANAEQKMAEDIEKFLCANNHV